MNAIRIPEDVLRVLDAAAVDGNRLVLTGQLDRKLYEQTAKVLDAAGGKWNRSAKAHVFDGPASDAIEPLILTGTYSRTKHDFGQFDTPPALAARVTEIAEIEPRMEVFEPSCGLGNLIAAIVAEGGDVLGVELDGKRCAAAKSRFANLQDPVVAIAHDDFLSCVPGIFYDRVVMNPPFAGQADIDHVCHAYKFLKPGGRLVSIMSAGVTFRDNRKTADFRAFIKGAGGSIEKLEDGAFKESGTAVSTCVVTAFS